MPRLRERLLLSLPILPVLAGLGLWLWRHHAGDPLGALLFGEAGMILMIVIAVRLPEARDGPRDPAPAPPRPRGVRSLR